MYGLLVGIFLSASCDGLTQTASPSDRKENKEKIDKLALMIESDLSKNGPTAWLNYFEDSPHFFMASNGELVFKDYKNAHSFITNVLVKNISKINLKWRNIKVDPYATDWGSIGADFHEDLIDPSGKIIVVDGYFTATAHQTSNGWKLRNAHWSIKPAN